MRPRLSLPALTFPRAVAFTWLCAFAFPLRASAETSRPMDEMHGDCSSYRMNVRKELAAWPAPAQKPGALDALEIGKKLALPLSAQASVRYLLEPEKRFAPKGAAYGGVFRFRAPKTGDFLISAGSKVWFDVVDVEAKTRVASSEFEMQTGCERIFKAVAFPLVAGRAYAIQFNGSAAPSAVAMISERTPESAQTAR